MIAPHASPNPAMTNELYFHSRELADGRELVTVNLVLAASACAARNVAERPPA